MRPLPRFLHALTALHAAGACACFRQDGGRRLQGRWGRQADLLCLPRSTARSANRPPYCQLDLFEGLGANSRQGFTLTLLSWITTHPVTTAEALCNFPHPLVELETATPFLPPPAAKSRCVVRGFA